MSRAHLIALLERSTCPYQQNLLPLSESGPDPRDQATPTNHVATSSGLMLQICLIMALSLHCKITGGLAWDLTCMEHNAPNWSAANAVVYPVWEVLRRENREQLNFLQTFFTSIIVARLQLPAAESMTPSSRRRLPHPTRQVQSRH